MKTRSIGSVVGKSLILCLLMGIVGGIASSRRSARRDENAPAPKQASKSDSPSELGPREWILVPHQGTNRLDLQIIRAQEKLRADSSSKQELEKLGWLYVAKARESFDPGFYKLAEQSALCLEALEPRSLAALLLRGHVLQNLHRFKEAEPLARELVSRRGRAFDWGLLGDVLMEQGNLAEAADAYQHMVDEKPELQAYARIAHLRWLKGDVAGAVQIMKLAVDSASPLAPEPAAWVNTRFAGLEFQQGQLKLAERHCLSALQYEREYAPALLLHGRLRLAQGDPSSALETLRRAAELNPLPEYQWTLSEALQATGYTNEAAEVEATLRAHGQSSDPRTFALYLATHGQMTATAVELARRELGTRADIFTHDALAWALAADGHLAEATAEMERALSENTQDGRLFLHAGVIAARAGQTDQARRWLERTRPFLPALLPSEQAHWKAAFARIDSATAARDIPGPSTFFTSQDQ